MEKKTIFYTINLQVENGTLKNSLHLLNLIAKTYNIILLEVESKYVDINRFIDENTRKSIIKKIKINFNDEISNKLKNNEYENNNISYYDQEILELLQNLKSHFNIDKCFIVNNNSYIHKYFVKILKIEKVNLYINDFGDLNEEYNKELIESINECDVRVYSPLEKVLKQCNNHFDTHLMFDYNLFLNVQEDYFSKLDNAPIIHTLLNIGFFNYLDHDKNGLWTILDYYKDIGNAYTNLNIYGRAPLNWDNYEESFIKEHSDLFNKGVVLHGWRNNITHQMKYMDSIISATSSNYNKISNTLIEGILLGKKVITTNENEYLLTKDYGVKLITDDKFVKKFIKIARKENSEKKVVKYKMNLANKLSLNDEKFINDFGGI